MKTVLRVLRLDFLPASVDLGLLVLRLWLGLSLLCLHGWTKLSGFQQMAGKFADPLGVGAEVSLSLAIMGEVVGALLVVLGLFTRLGALASAITMGVAFFLVHNAVLKGSGSGEMAFIYLAGFVALLIAGPGRFALDASSGKGAKKAPRESRN